MSGANEVREVLLTPPPHASPAAGVCAFRFPRICTLHLLLALPAAGSQHALEPPRGESSSSSCVISFGAPVMVARREALPCGLLRSLSHLVSFMLFPAPERKTRGGASMGTGLL